jgi:flavin-dependent dehydrogenase
LASHSNALKTDVAIIGAGPAGAATAISCARAGLATVILDRERSTRERPGETLHPGIEALLEELGVAERVSQAGFPRHEGIWVCWDTPSHFVPYGADAAGYWRGYQAWGADLDSILLTRALELGGEVLRPCRALDPIVSEGQVRGLESTLGTIEAKFLVDASGPGHWLARRLGLAIRRRSPRLIARFGYREGTCPDRDEAPAITADERGWTWIAKIRPSLYHWTRLNLDERMPDANYVPTELRELSPRGRSRGADVSWRIVERPAGPGYYVVGDAAAVLDPASSHGVLKAVLSGMLAARMMVKALAFGNGASAARSYGEWVNDRFEHDVAGLRDLYARLPRSPHWVRVGSAIAERALMPPM